jgi:tight adherence protein B
MPPISIGSGALLYALILSAVFAGIFLLTSTLCQFIVSPWRRRREVAKRVQDERLTMMARSGLLRSDIAGQKNIFLTVCGKIFSQERLVKLQQTLLQADIYIGLPLFINIVIISASLGIIIAWFSRSFYLQLALGLMGGWLPFLYLRLRQQRKARLIEKQMPDAMEFLARSLRAGHTLAASVDLAAHEVDHPLGSELRLAHEEQRLGLSMPVALEHMAERTTSKDLRYFVSAINIQHEVGGNLAEVMETIGSLIRDRLNLKAKMFALTAHIRSSATLLTILPVALFFLVYKLNPDYAGVLLTDPAGRKLLLTGIIFIGFGSIIMRKMANIKV